LRTNRINCGIFLQLLLLGAGMFDSGCSHYQLGTQSKLAFSTLYVAPVENRAMVPQAQALVSTDVRDALIKDGRVTVVSSPESADAVLHVSLVGYDRDVAAASQTDTGLARKFALNLHASCSLTDRRTGHPYFSDRKLDVTKDAFTDSGQLQSEYQALPLLASALADRVAQAVLDVW
jgi:Lipopolysaccharide-assembly